LSPNATQKEKSEALQQAQGKFQDLQFPRAQRAALDSAKAFEMTFKKSARERAEELRQTLQG